MTETSEQRTRRKFRTTLNKYNPRWLTSIQFTRDPTPEDVILYFTKIKKDLSYHHRGVLIFWLRTNRTDYGETYAMINIFTHSKIDEKFLRIIAEDEICYKCPKGPWTEKDFARWLKNKEMFNNDVFRSFYSLKIDGRRNISRLSIVNKKLAFLDDDTTHRSSGDYFDIDFSNIENIKK